MADVKTVLFRSLEDLRNGRLDADLARAVGYLAGMAAKVVESAEFEPRIAKLEATFVSLVERVEADHEY